VYRPRPRNDPVFYRSPAGTCRFTILPSPIGCQVARKLIGAFRLGVKIVCRTYFTYGSSKSFTVYRDGFKISISSTKSVMRFCYCVTRKTSEHRTFQIQTTISSRCRRVNVVLKPIYLNSTFVINWLIFTSRKHRSTLKMFNGCAIIFKRFYHYNLHY